MTDLVTTTHSDSQNGSVYSTDSSTDLRNSTVTRMHSDSSMHSGSSMTMRTMTDSPTHLD